MTRFFTLVALALICSLPAMAQTAFTPGYVITTKGDTLRGEIKYNPKKSFPQYRKVTLKISETEIKTFKADKLKKYVMGDTEYLSWFLEEEQVFIKCLSTGAIALYEAQFEFINSKNETEVETQYYIQKNGSSDMEKLKSAKFRKQVAEYVSDHAELVKDLEEKKYDLQNVPEVVNTYNEWVKQKS